MAFNAAVTATEALITAIPDSGLANGHPYANTAMPSTAHVRPFLKWPMNNDNTHRTLSDHLCRYSRVEVDATARNAIADKVDIETGVIISVCRLAAARYYGWVSTSFNVSEVLLLAPTAAALAVHADHQTAVATALTEWSVPAARYMGLFFYNSISYETANHHHKPEATKKLATTTITLAGLKDFIAGDALREGAIFHDMFHPLSDTLKSNAARAVGARQHLSDLKFDNLRKRIPVKAPDSGVAINYPVLYRKARAYHHDPADLPVTLAPPPSVTAAIAAYEAAADAAALTTAVARLRALSAALEEPSAYLAGYILGNDAKATGDADLDLRTAKRTNTILGCPAYARAASEYPGSFTFGKERGFARVGTGIPSQVLPRVVAAVAAAATL